MDNDPRQVTLTEAIEAAVRREVGKALGEARRDAGIAKAEEHAPDGWNEEAEAAVLEVARRLNVFTADDVWASGLRKPHEPRALGAVMKRLAKAGVIQLTGHVERTTQASRNRGYVATWRRA